MLNKILTIPFFIIFIGLPLGIVMLLMMIPMVETWLCMYGEWSFKQWEKKRDKLGKWS